MNSNHEKTESMGAQFTVVSTHRIHDSVKMLLSRECEVIANETQDSWPSEGLSKRAGIANGLLVFPPDRIDESFLAKCPKLKIVAGALKGNDNIDVEACSRRGVWVTVAPDLLSPPTAELALALSLALLRNVPAGERLVRSGNFHGWRPLLYGSTLMGKTAGIIGMGKIGQAFARLLAGFNARIIYYDPVHMSPVQEAFFGIVRSTLDQVLSESDLLVLILPLTAASLHLINDETLRKMKKDAYLVNVGRGSVVDEAAVARALAQGQLSGYAADVFEMEDQSRSDRLPAIHPALLANLERTVFTPHLGSAVDQVRLEIEMSAAENILQVLRGERPRDAVNQIQQAVPKS